MSDPIDLPIQFTIGPDGFTTDDSHTVSLTLCQGVIGENAPDVDPRRILQLRQVKPHFRPFFARRKAVAHKGVNMRACHRLHVIFP